MRALVLTREKTLEYRTDFPTPEPSVGEDLVRVRTAALNHRDVWIIQGLYPGIVFPVVLGSDGAGICRGREVLINPSIGWGNNPAFQAKGYHILGMPRHGTLSEYVTVPAMQVYAKPLHLTMQEAAALPLAGLTAWRAVFSKGAVQPGERVLVTGIGGGVALFAMQFALSAGAQVWVSSGHEEKLEKAKALGAEGGVNYRQNDWLQRLQQLAEGFDVVIDGAGGPGLGQILKLCQPGARVVVYGGSQGAVPDIKPQALFWKQISILGTSMGHDAEFAAMLNWVSRHKIRPVIDSVFSLSDGHAAFERMAQGQQFGKIILEP